MMLNKNVVQEVMKTFEENIIIFLETNVLYDVCCQYVKVERKSHLWLFEVSLKLISSHEKLVERFMLSENTCLVIVVIGALLLC